MNSLRRRKFNTLYWTYAVVAFCTLVMTSVDYTSVLAALVGVSAITFYNFDERGKCVFEEEEELGE